MFKSLQTQLTLLFAAFVLLVVVSVGAMMWGSETQRQDAALINLAGRQRMLAQQMARLALDADQARVVDRALLDVEQTFEQTLHALLEGGAAPYPSGATVTLAGTRDADTRFALMQVGLTWNEFRVLLDDLQQASRDATAFLAARQAIEVESYRLVERADAVVRLYEANATAKINRLRAMQIGFLVGALLLLGIGAWVTRESVLAPLQGLSHAAVRLGENDLDSPVQVAGPEEMQTLSMSFDSMRKSLRASRSELLDLMATLEARVAQRTRELNALNEVSCEITSQLEVRHVLTSVTEKVRVLLNGDCAMLCLLDEEQQHLLLQAVSGDPPLGTTSDRVSTVDRASAVLTSHQALVCSNAHCMGGCGLLANTHAASHVVAPLRVGDSVIGAMCVSSLQPDHFPGEATDVVTKLANTAAVALQNAQLYAQAEKVATLEERNRIAADMHDGLGQTLSYLGLITDQTAELLAAGEDGAALAHLERMRRTINDATRQIRAAIQQLMDGALHERKLPDLLHDTVDEFQARCQTQIQWQAGGDAPTAVPRAMMEQVLNVTREALENACRHAHAHSISVHLGRENGNGFVRIEDDGCGFDPMSPGAEPPGHFGLQVMKARATHIGGECLIESSPGAGTRVTLTFPPEETRA